MSLTFHLDLLSIDPLLPILLGEFMLSLSSLLLSLASFKFHDADSHLGGPSQPPDPNLNIVPVWDHDAYPLLNLPYAGYDNSQITYNEPGQPALPWQQLPGDESGVDAASFTALLNSPLDSFATSLTPAAHTPMAEMPVAQPAVQNVGRHQAPQRETAIGYRPQTTHVLIRPKPTPGIPPEDSNDDHDEEEEGEGEEEEPIPKRRRKRRLPLYLQKIEAEMGRRQAERIAAEAQAAGLQNSTSDYQHSTAGFQHSPADLQHNSTASFQHSPASFQHSPASFQHSTVDLTNGMDHLLHCLEIPCIFANCTPLQLTMMHLRPPLLTPKKKKSAMA